MDGFQMSHVVQIDCNIVGRAGLVEEKSEDPKRMCFVESNDWKGIAVFALVDKSYLKPIRSEEVIR